MGFILKYVMSIFVFSFASVALADDQYYFKLLDQINNEGFPALNANICEMDSFPRSDMYSGCQSTTKNELLYKDVYRPYITEKFKVIFQDANVEILLCLLLRESSGWEGSASHTNVVGLSQFTSGTLSEMGEIIKKGSIYWERHIANQISVNEENERIVRKLQGMKGATKKLNKYKDELNKGISFLESFRRRQVMANAWEQLGGNDLKVDFSTGYFGNKKNYEANFLLTITKLRMCAYDFNNNYTDVTPDMILLACAGAYNIGESSFANLTLEKGQDLGNLSQWIDRLSISGNSQAPETVNHLISINRCAMNGPKLPMCGTNYDYCTDYVDPCTQPNAYLCRDECKK